MASHFHPASKLAGIQWDFFINRKGAKVPILPGPIPAMIRQLLLEYTPETLHRRIIVAIPFPAHRCNHALLLQQVSEVIGAVFGCHGQNDEAVLCQAASATLFPVLSVTTTCEYFL